MRDHVHDTVIDLYFLYLLSFASELSHSLGHCLFHLALLEFEKSLLFGLAKVAVKDTDLELYTTDEKSIEAGYLLPNIWVPNSYSCKEGTCSGSLDLKSAGSIV